MTMFDSRQILPNLNVSNLNLHKPKNKFCCYTHLVVFLQLLLDHCQEGSYCDEKWSLAALDLKKHFYLFQILKASPQGIPTRHPPKDIFWPTGTPFYATTMKILTFYSSLMQSYIRQSSIPVKNQTCDEVQRV